MYKIPDMETLNNMSDEEIETLRRKCQLRVVRNLAIFIGVKLATMILLRRMAKRLL